jgi:hypothetical protein
MFALRAPAVATAGVVLASLTAACGGGQPLQPQAAASAFSPPARTTPDASGCGGTHGVKVRPCPVTITKAKPMPVVTVSGPNVVDSAVLESACEKKDICSLGQFSSNPLEYYVYPLTKCGSAVIYADGYNNGGGTVGIGHLKVINKDC